MKIVPINIALALFFLSTLMASAQKRSYERVKAHKMAFIVDHSNLNSAEESLFWEIFGAAEDSIYKTLFRDKRALKKELREKSATLTAQEIKAKIERLDQMEIEKVEIVKNRNQALMNQLSPQKALEIIHAADEFNREMFRRGQQRDQKSKEEESKN